ncbi:MAG: hypothetical protein KME46_07970 [Brasilonema angustatum HA4187-MV1]|nr:hypothetical protein [Brasilonema angustatum HA4187-MV1]
MIFIFNRSYIQNELKAIKHVPKTPATPDLTERQPATPDSICAHESRP